MSNHNEEFSVGTGSVMTTQSGIAGLPPDVPPVNKSPNIVRRKRQPHDRFAGKAVFRVDPKTFHECYLGKRKNEHYEKYLKNSPYLEEIREYGRANWGESIIVQNEMTGEMVFLKYGSKPSVSESMKSLNKPKAAFPDSIRNKYNQSTGQMEPDKYGNWIPKTTSKDSSEKWSVKSDVIKSKARAEKNASLRNAAVKNMSTLKNYLSNRPPRG